MSNQNYNDHVAPPQKLVPEELRRYVTAPIPPQFMREYFENKEILFVIDYKASRLKGPVLLMYLINLAMPVDVQVNLKDYDEFSELMLAYFEHPGVVDSMSLAALAGEVILHFTRVPKEYRLTQIPIEESFLERFCSENEHTLATWCVFLDSMLTYIGKRLAPALGADEPDPPILDKTDVIGQNVVNLLRFPDFLSYYFSSSQLQAQVYFKQQFDEPIFGGKYLAYYFLCESNSVNQLLQKDSAEKIVAGMTQLVKHFQQTQQQKET